MQITTERLVLREFVADDWAAVLAYQSNPRYLRFYEWEGRTEQGVRDFVGMFLGYQREEPRYRFQLAVTLREDGGLIGNCGVRLVAPGARVAEIGYELAPEHWGRGYATEAARAMAAFGFAELGLHRLQSYCVADNIASARVLEKIGMRREGHLREAQWYKGRWWDTLLYGMLEGEWRERIGEWRMTN